MRDAQAPLYHEPPRQKTCLAARTLPNWQEHASHDHLSCAAIAYPMRRPDAHVTCQCGREAGAGRTTVACVLPDLPAWRTSVASHPVHRAHGGLVDVQMCRGPAAHDGAPPRPSSAECRGAPPVVLLNMHAHRQTRQTTQPSKLPGGCACSCMCCSAGPRHRPPPAGIHQHHRGYSRGPSPPLSTVLLPMLLAGAAASAVGRPPAGPASPPSQAKPSSTCRRQNAAERCQRPSTAQLSSAAAIQAPAACPQLKPSSAQLSGWPLVPRPPAWPPAFGTLGNPGGPRPA